MKISVIGSGYVGLVTGACLSNLGHVVTCIDINKTKIGLLKEGNIPFYEPGLQKIVQKNLEINRLYFSSSFDSISDSQITFICVGTPGQENGNVDLQFVDAAAAAIAERIKAYQVIVVKSTTPVGTTERVKKIIIQKNSNENFFDVVSNPEFLREGSAVRDFIEPERIVIGTSSKKALNILKEIYNPTLKNETQFLVMDERSSELSKYAANAMLATRISFMNELALFCDKSGADIRSVQHVLGTDSRIGPHFLSSGLGYGGSCFPKDVRALIGSAITLGIDLKILRAVQEVNQFQPHIFIKKIADHFGGEQNLKRKTITILGLSFKPETDDIRDAPALSLIHQLLAHEVVIHAYDPIAEKNVRAILGEKIIYFENVYNSLEGADALILCTEWNEFQNLDFVRVKKVMAKPFVFDGRNVLDATELKEKGFQYYGIGLN